MPSVAQPASAANAIIEIVVNLFMVALLRTLRELVTCEKREMARFTLLTVLVLASCGGSAKKTAPVTPRPAPSPPLAAKPEPAVPDEPPPPEPEEPDEPAEPPPEPVTMTFEPKAPKVELLSKGKGKRAPLRYKVAVGDSVDCSMVMDLSVKSAVTVSVPTTTMSWTGSVTSVDKPSFTATANVDVLEVAEGTDPLSQRAGEEVMKKLLPMRGGTIITTMTDRGVPVKTQFTSIGQLDPQTAMGMQLGAGGGIVLPEQPIGIGGKWRVTRVEDQGLIVTTTVATFVLVSRTADGATIHGDVVATGKSSLAADTVARGTSELVFNGGACSASKATMHTDLPPPVNMAMDMVMETRQRLHEDR
jgi:hypothetical protein